MTNELNQKFQQVLAHLGDDKMNSALRNMPITKGQVLTFTGETKLVETTLRDQQGNIISYGAFATKEGFDVPFTQIARRNNGLGLNNATMKEALEEFAGRIDGTYNVRVADVKKIESSFGDGKMTYLVFAQA